MHHEDALSVRVHDEAKGGEDRGHHVDILSKGRKWIVSEKQPRQVTEAYLGSLVLDVYMAARPCNRSGKSWVTR